MILLKKTFEGNQFFEATEEVARLIPELGRLFPDGPVICPKGGRQTALAESLLELAAWQIFEGRVTGNLFICRRGLSYSTGFFRVDYYAEGERIQTTISLNVPQWYTFLPTRRKEIREAALAIGWEDGNP